MNEAAMQKHVSLTWQQILLAAVAIVVCALLFWNPRSQAPSWIYPYFSGAANLGPDLAWRVDTDAYTAFEQMTYGEQLNHRFERSDSPNLAAYSVLDRGYVFIIWIAQNLLFWLPQIKAVIWLQIIFHALSSLWVANRLSTRRQQLIFMLAYALNPVVLHFVTFAYHYYWQVIPSLAWLWYERQEATRLRRTLPVLLLVLAGAFLIRQSTIIVSLLILSCLAWQHRKAAGWIAVAAFLAFALVAKNPSQPWHTAYVGIGAYPNATGIALDDESGYKAFKDITGIRIDTTPPNGNYYDEKIRAQYYEVLKQQLTSYAKSHPLELARNSALNILQGFSVGYPVGHPMLAYVSAAIGLAALLAMLACGMYVKIALLLGGVAGFIVYYPPIPAYMFGNYLLLSLALAAGIDQLAAAGRSGTFGRYLKERLFRQP